MAWHGMMVWLAAGIAVAAFASPSWAEGTVAIPDGPGLLQQLSPHVLAAPRTYPVPERDEGSIKAIFYEGLPYKGRATRVFAYVGMPQQASVGKVPAVVLVHGGGGTAFAEWVRIWNDRGYAAIAMDLEGHVPQPQNQPVAHEHSGPSRQGIFGDIQLPLEEQWMYHAIADVMLANSLLTAQPEVDADRIGVVGISWGGMITGVVAGVDPRFRFAVPVYACGFVYDSKGVFGLLGSSDPSVSQGRLWDPARFLTQSTLPILWVNGDSDNHFSLDATTRSYEATAGSSFMTVHPAMKHGHPPGWDPTQVPEIYVFADSVVRGGTSLPRITQQPEGRAPVLYYMSDRPIVEALVIYATEPLRYESNRICITWKSISANVDATAGSVSVDLPQDAKVYYINLTDDRGCIVSSCLRSLP